jgi:hypothetical protein
LRGPTGPSLYTPDDEERSFALAGDEMRFGKEELRAAVLHAGALEVSVCSRRQMIEVIGGAQPITADDMRVVMQRSWQHLEENYLPEVLE